MTSGAGEGVGSSAREVCAACGFDSHLYDRADTVSSQPIIGPVLGAAAEGLDDRTLSTRPDDSTWSIAEYTDHVRETAFGNRFAIEAALADPGTDLGDPPERRWKPEPASIDHGAALGAVNDEYRLMQELLVGLTDEDWDKTVKLGGRNVSVGWFARHVLHDGLHHLADIGRIRHRLGFGPDTEVGRISGLFVSDGGVPKEPVESTAIGPEGVTGDRQADRKHHGRPVQAVSLWSADVIGALAAEGHPIVAGSAGENVTISGVDWAALRPGARLDVGSVPLLISAHAVPCAKNARWFSDRDFNRMLHRKHPGRSRLYAIPLGRETVTVGDTVTVEP